MTTVERDTEFRERLIAYYKDGDFQGADFVISMCAQHPAEHLDTPARTRGLLFALELWAAIDGHPHAAIAGTKIDIWQWPRQRCVATAQQAVTALFWLSQSPFGAEFADDTHDLRARLFAIVHRHDAYDRQADAQVTST